MAGGEDGRNPAGIKKMVERLKAAGNVNVKRTEFAGADHRKGGKAVFNTGELVDWMLGFNDRRSRSEFGFLVIKEIHRPVSPLEYCLGTSDNCDRSAGSSREVSVKNL